MHRLQTLGGLALFDETGERIDELAGHTRALALLAYLAVEGADERIAREELVGLLWPDRPDERARKALRQALYRLRQATDVPLVGGKGEQNLWVESARLAADVAAFREAKEDEEHARALELYAGPFLAGVHVSDAPRFERWVDRRRGELREQAYEAALSVGASARDAGDMAAAEDAFRQALDLAPLREEAARKLIGTLADRGRPADALQLYEAFRQRREAELEMAPSEDLQQQVEELKRAPPAASDAVEEADRAPAPNPGGQPSDEADASAAEPAERPSPASGASRGREPSYWGGFRRRTLLGALVAVALLGGLLAGAWHLRSESDGTAAAAAGDRSVAVLPFEAIGTEDPGPIAEGLHRDLLTRLSRVSGLEVKSAASVDRYQHTDLDLPAIADSLGVTWVVEGDVQRVGGAIQVNAQLVDPRTDTQAWADTYRQELTAENLFNLQSEITGRIARSLKAELSPGEQQGIEGTPTADLEAYRLYARGRALLAQRTDSAMGRAEDLFRRAIRRDSTFAPAWATLGKALVIYPQARGRDPDSVFPLGRKAADRALELDPELAEAHLALGIIDFYRMRGPAALQRHRRVLSLEPNNATAHHGLNLLHLVFGRPEEALKHAQRAIVLSPMSPEKHQGLALASLARGDPERGLRAARRAREIEPDYGGPFLERYALYRLGELPPPDTAGGVGVRSRLTALAEATSGDTTRAANLLATLEEDRDLPPPFWTGLLHAALGHRAEALDAFGGAFRRREEDMSGGGLTITLRYYYPDVLGPLRTDPRWDALIRRINVGWGLNPDGSLPENAAEQDG